MQLKHSLDHRDGPPPAWGCRRACELCTLQKTTHGTQTATSPVMNWACCLQTVRPDCNHHTMLDGKIILDYLNKTATEDRTNQHQEATTRHQTNNPRWIHGTILPGHMLAKDPCFPHISGTTMHWDFTNGTNNKTILTELNDQANKKTSPRLLLPPPLLPAPRMTRRLHQYHSVIYPRPTRSFVTRMAATGCRSGPKLTWKPGKKNQPTSTTTSSLTGARTMIQAAKAAALQTGEYPEISLRLKVNHGNVLLDTAANVSKTKAKRVTLKPCGVSWDGVTNHHGSAGEKPYRLFSEGRGPLGSSLGFDLSIGQ